ncbi:MAG: phosphomannomutase, partial [Armatimonadetes bacterium]|nr:phosphomannomutase [Armatimonadota bacterium]
MSVVPEIFREYDIRGVVGRELTSAAAERIAQAFGTYLREAGVSAAVVGRDNRASSPEFSQAVAAGLRSTGCDVVD